MELAVLRIDWRSSWRDVQRGTANPSQAMCCEADADAACWMCYVSSWIVLPQSNEVRTT